MSCDGTSLKYKTIYIHTNMQSALYQPSLKRSPLIKYHLPGYFTVGSLKEKIFASKGIEISKQKLIDTVTGKVFKDHEPVSIIKNELTLIIQDNQDINIKEEEHNNSSSSSSSSSSEFTNLDKVIADCIQREDIKRKKLQNEEMCLRKDEQIFLKGMNIKKEKNNNDDDDDSNNNLSDGDDDEYILNTKFKGINNLDTTLHKEVAYLIQFKDINTAKEFNSSKYKYQDNFIKSKNFNQSNVSIEDYIISELIPSKTKSTQKEANTVKGYLNIQPPLPSEYINESNDNNDNNNNNRKENDDNELTVSLSSEDEDIQFSYLQQDKPQEPSHKTQLIELESKGIINDILTITKPDEIQRMFYSQEISRILSLTNITYNEMHLLNKYITSILNTYKPDNMFSNKLNIVFDLDNTLLYSKTNDLIDDRWFTLNNIFKYEVEIQGKFIRGIYMFRPGLKEFFAKTKSFCSYYIYSMGINSYAEYLSEKLQNEYNVTFEKTIGRISDIELKKYLHKLHLDPAKTVIIDDQVQVWDTLYGKSKFNNLHCLINSYKFIAEAFMGGDIGRFMKKDMMPFCYCYTDINNHFSLRYQGDGLFVENKKGIPYHIEYERSQKFQFEYLSGFLKDVYTLNNYLKCECSLLIKILKCRILLGYTFSLRYVDCVNKTDLFKMIETCGGKVFDHLLPEKITHMIVDDITLDEFKQFYSRVTTHNDAWKHIRIVNPKFIFDCFFMGCKMDEQEDMYQLQY